MPMNPGYLVETKTGIKGRTYHSKGLVNGKVPVYECTKEVPTEIEGLTVCSEFSDKALLCNPGTIKIIGFID